MAPIFRLSDVVDDDGSVPVFDTTTAVDAPNTSWSCKYNKPKSAARSKHVIYTIKQFQDHRMIFTFPFDYFQMIAK